MPNGIYGQGKAQGISQPLMPNGIHDKAVIAQGLHLLPFRTEKLNLVTSMVLPTRESRKPPPYRGSDSYSLGLFFIRCF